VNAKPPTAEIGVAVANRRELAFSETHEEEQLERDAVAQLGLGGDDARDVVG
jgi:hypothetical protein